MNVSESNLLEVTKANVEAVCEAYLNEHQISPTKRAIVDAFTHPSSVAISVYLKEWKHENDERIKLMIPTVATMRKLLEVRDAEMRQLACDMAVAERELHELKDWLASHHQSILQRYETGGVSIE